ncbi:MAG TPA: HD domain-containing phosphohydrolase [Myxococcota bacterium]|jgi:putative nucleotidyltransferase with HDIG domain
MSSATLTEPVNTLSGPADIELAKTVAFRFAASFAARRLYADGNPALGRTLDLLTTALEACFARRGVESVAIGLMQGGLSVAGVPLLHLPDTVERVALAMRKRSLEIISIDKSVKRAELETLLSLLIVESAELLAVDIGKWLLDRGARHVTVKHLDLAEDKTAKSMRELYANGRDLVGKEYKRAVEKGVLELGAMGELASSMLDLVLRSDVPVSTVLALRGREDFTYVHSMNVSLLASAQAATLAVDEAMVRSIGIAGLVHDIGKTTVPESVLAKRTTLTAGEAEMVRNHSAEGARILLRTQGGGGLEAIVAAEHHVPYTQEPHVASQIVAIADAFDSIRSQRPFSDRASLRMALRFMQKQLRHRLNPYLLQRFCLMCGMYLPGDVVHLSTGEVARVVANHAELGSRPTVEVVDRGIGRAPAGSVADLSLPHLSQLRIKKEPTLAFADLTVDAVEAMA